MSSTLLWIGCVIIFGYVLYTVLTDKNDKDSEKEIKKNNDVDFDSKSKDKNLKNIFKSSFNKIANFKNLNKPEDINLDFEKIEALEPLKEKTKPQKTSVKKLKEINNLEENNLTNDISDNFDKNSKQLNTELDNKTDNNENDNETTATLIIEDVDVKNDINDDLVEEVQLDEDILANTSKNTNENISDGDIQTISESKISPTSSNKESIIVLDDTELKELEEYANSRKGRGGFDPQADRILTHNKYKARQRNTLVLLTIFALSLILGIIFSSKSFYISALSFVSLGFYLLYLRQATTLENRIRNQRLVRLKTEHDKAVQDGFSINLAKQYSFDASKSFIPNTSNLQIVDMDDIAPDFYHLPRYKNSTVEQNQQNDFKHIAG